MTIQFKSGGRITGLSTDTKPTDLPDHYIFHETDTGDDFTLLSGVWILKHTTLDDTIGDAEIQTHTSTKISITNKAQLNSQIAYKDAVNIFTAAAQRFGNGVISFLNPLATLTYTIITSAITLNRNITLPLLTANDTFVFEDHPQTLTNKIFDTIIMSDGTIGSRIPNKTVEVFSINDFPTPVAGIITLDVDTTYILHNPIVTSDRFIIQNNSLNLFTTINTSSNTFTYIGSDTFFTSAPGSTSGRINFQDMFIFSSGSATFFDLDGHDVEFFKCVVANFAKFGEVKNASIVHIRFTNIASMQQGAKFIDIGIVNLLQAGFLNTVDTIDALITIIGTNSAINIINTQMNRLTNESALYIDPNIGNAGVLINQTIGTNGAGFFKVGATGFISNLADSITNPGIKTTVTSTAHGLLDAEAVNIVGTVSYNGTFLISNVTTNTFDIEVVFVANDGIGSWDSNSLSGDDPRVSVLNVLNVKDSTVSGELSFLNIATPQLVTIAATSTPVAINGGNWTSSNLERITADLGNNGIATYTGVETADFQVTFSALLEKLTGGATDIGLTVLINGVDVTTNPPHSVNAGIIQISATRIFTLNTGDTVQLAVFNDGDTNNIEISQVNMSITK